MLYSTEKCRSCWTIHNYPVILIRQFLHFRGKIHPGKCFMHRGPIQRIYTKWKMTALVKWKLSSQQPWLKCSVNEKRDFSWKIFRCAVWDWTHNMKMFIPPHSLLQSHNHSFHLVKIHMQSVFILVFAIPGSVYLLNI